MSENTAIVIPVPESVPATGTGPEFIAVEPPKPQQQQCRLCRCEGKHPLPEQPATCVVCEAVHGASVERQVPVGSAKPGKPRRMALKSRNVAVRHSLPVERDGGRNDHGGWVNPQAKWVAPAICDDCAFDLRRGAFDLRDEAKAQGAKPSDLPPVPRFFDLVANRAECEARDARDVEFRAERDERRAAEDKRRERIGLLLAKGYRISRSSNGGQRGDQRGRDGNGSDRGGQRRPTDRRGNPQFGGRGYVTPDDVA